MPYIYIIGIGFRVIELYIIIIKTNILVSQLSLSDTFGRVLRV